MQIQSPLSNLREVLSEVRAKALPYKTTLWSNEAATRAALIDPVLKALGWDIANPNMVEVEKTLGGANSLRLDYALFNDSNEIKAIVEAKSSSQILGNHAQTLVSYAFQFKVKSLFLTNGTVWHHYTKFDPTNYAPNKVFDLSSDDLAEVAAYLVENLDAAKFWPEQPDVDVLAQRIGQLESDLSSLQQQVNLLSQGQIIPPPPPSPRQWTELTNISNAMKTQPSFLRLPDDMEITVKSWKGVLVEACKFVLGKNLSIPVPHKDSANGSVDLIRDVMPPPKRSFVTESYNGKTVYLYANYSADNCINNALHVLSLLPQSPKKPTLAVVYAPTP